MLKSDQANSKERKKFMPAFFVATNSIKDSEKFEEYVPKAIETIKSFGGETLLLGKADGALTGSVNHQFVGITRFPDMTALNNWYESEAYQALVLLREEAAETVIVKYEQLS
jgi:uncharacterized protein (DUF1330 family)